MPDRASALPAGVEAYRTIGSFDAGTLPAGLRHTHDLKAGTWAKLSLEQGALGFVWEDDAGGRIELAARAELVIPPQIPHHVEGDDFRVSITFYR